MTEVKILAAFETEINKINDAVGKPATDDSLFWLNLAIAKFTKERFNGDLVHRTSYEQNEKRRNDLIRLYRTKTYLSCDMNYHEDRYDYDSYSIIYPNDFLFATNEDVLITDASGENGMNTSVFECTSDSFMYRITNSLTDFHYRHHRARPIRIRESYGCKLLTDKKYKINKYTLGYLKTPKELTLEDPFEEYADFDDITMYEIIKIAAQMYLENASDLRYLTISAEVNTQE